MRVAIAGGHGGIGRRLIPILAERDDQVLSIDRNPAYGSDLRKLGADPVVCDLEMASVPEVAEALGSPDAAVFSVGAGSGSGAERKWTIDYAGAVKLIAACAINRVQRFIMVSSMRADPDVTGDDTFAVYLRAKGRADAELARSGLDHTILRPTRLTDDPGTGMIEIGERLETGEISRDDVAALVAAVLRSPRSIGLTIEARSGDTPIDRALEAL